MDQKLKLNVILIEVLTHIEISTSYTILQTEIQLTATKIETNKQKKNKKIRSKTNFPFDFKHTPTLNIAFTFARQKLGVFYSVITSL